MPQMEALREFRFAGRQINVGDPITCTESEAKVLRAMQRAKPVAVYETRVMHVEDPIPGRKPRKPRAEGQPRRQYRRRDMQAEN